MKRLKLFVLLLCLVTYATCHSGEGKIDKEKQNKDKKDEPGHQEHQSKSKQTGGEPQQKQQKHEGDDDYDTTQGYPILFPETHMMTSKRNTTSPNVTSSNNVTEIDDELYDDLLNNTDDEQGKCSKAVDILFLLDSSESVKYSNWKIIIQFVKDLCNRFQLHSTRVSIIRYASEAEVALPLSEFNSTELRDIAIDNIFYKTGGTRTDIALKKASEVLHIEEQRSQVLMLVTDGPTNRLEIDKDHFVEGKDLVAGPADRLKDAGVALFCIGVEPDSETPEEIETMKEEMSLIASEPTKMHLFMSDGYRELERKVQLISNAACVVNGAWSNWSDYSPCSVTCGYGTKVRMRTCTNPRPENNGADCTGPRVEIEECDLGSCGDVKAPTPSTQTHSMVKSKSMTGNATTQPRQSNETQASHENISVNNTTHNETANEIILKKPDETANSRNETEKSHEEHEGKPIVMKEFQNKTDSESKPEEKQQNSELKKGDNHVDEQAHFKNGCIEGLEELKLNDSQYNSSSIYSHNTDDEYVKKEYAPQNARLNNQINGGGWCAEHKFATTGDKNQYLQFDLGKKMSIDAVGTQGSHLLENWVKKYNLRYSDDGISWEYYNKNPLEGNIDRTSIQRHQLTPSVEARYIQLNPIEWNEQTDPEKHDICMRAALFKCKEGAIAPVKRGIIQPNSHIIKEAETLVSKIPRGVVLKEREWSHLPDQKTVLTLYSERIKRELSHHKHHKGHKRIFRKLRKTANKMLRKFGNKIYKG